MLSKIPPTDPILSPTILYCYSRIRFNIILPSYVKKNGIAYWVLWRSYRLNDPEFEFRQGQENFCIPKRLNRHFCQPAFYSMGTSCFPTVMRLGREVGHSTPTSAKVRNAWSSISAPPIRLDGVGRNILTFSTYDKNTKAVRILRRHLTLRKTGSCGPIYYICPLFFRSFRQMTDYYDKWGNGRFLYLELLTAPLSKQT